MKTKTRYEQFAEKIETETKARMKRQYPNLAEDDKFTTVKIKSGHKYTKIDVETSGKYMIDQTTGVIYGIKAYGVVNKKRIYGTLDTIDEWYWGGYVGVKIN